MTLGELLDSTWSPERQPFLEAWNSRSHPPFSREWLEIWLMISQTYHDEALTEIPKVRGSGASKLVDMWRCWESGNLGEDVETLHPLTKSFPRHLFYLAIPELL